jgi:hypothetical protein
VEDHARLAADARGAVMIPRSYALAAVGFVNWVVPDFQGDPEPVVSAVFGRRLPLPRTKESGSSACVSVYR